MVFHGAEAGADVRVKSVLILICVILTGGTLGFCICPQQSANLTHERKSDWSVPDSALKAFKASRVLEKYDIPDSLNPFYLRGDLDGDGKPDYVIRVQNGLTKHFGLAIVLSSQPTVQVLGAGGVRIRVGFGADSYLLDDFDWMDAWQIMPKQPLIRNKLNEKVLAQMRGEGILVEKTESAEAILFWDGKQFRWYQTSD